MELEEKKKRPRKRLTRDEQLVYDYLLDVFFKDPKLAVGVSIIGKELNRRAAGTGCKYRNWAIVICESLVEKGFIIQSSKTKFDEKFRLGKKADLAVAVELSKIEYENVSDKNVQIIYENLEHIRTMRRMGIPVKEIAARLGVSKDMLYRFVKVFPHLKHYFNEGKHQANTEVANAVLTRAIGYDTLITKTSDIIDKNGIPTGNTKIQTETRHVPGDVRAMAFWLLNRDSGHWQDKRNVSIDGKLSLNALMKDIASNEDKESSTRISDKLDPTMEVDIQQQA